MINQNSNSSNIESGDINKPSISPEYKALPPQKKSNGDTIIGKMVAYLLLIALGFFIGYQFNSDRPVSITENAVATSTNPSLKPESTNKNNNTSEKADLSLFWLVWEELEDNYVTTDVIDYDKMVYGAIKGMVESLEDPYTVFMTPAESKEFSDSLEGTLEGIGAELSMENGNLVVVSPIRNSPAEKAGLLPGDIIFKINGELTSDLDLFDAIMRIRGEKGTKVVLTIVREKVEAPIELSIVRDSIDLEIVSSELLEGNIMYVSINQFNDKTIGEFSKVVSEMLVKTPKGLIIDLRYNGGGYLETAVDLLSFLLPSKTEAVMIKQRNKKDNHMYTGGGAKILDIPLVVLANEGSASASEIVAGAIQDHKRGVLMGTKTFGKGTVQEVESFSDGSLVRITIAKWFTPKGRTIDKTGLEPDILVEFTEEDIAKQIDSQKEAAAKYLRELQ